jgi:hypothetical protein
MDWAMFKGQEWTVNLIVKVFLFWLGSELTEKFWVALPVCWRLLVSFRAMIAYACHEGTAWGFPPSAICDQSISVVRNCKSRCEFLLAALSLTLSTHSRKRDSGGFVRKLGGFICRRTREWTNEQATRISHEVLSPRPWRQSRQPLKLMIA